MVGRGGQGGCFVCVCGWVGGWVGGWLGIGAEKEKIEFELECFFLL